MSAEVEALLRERIALAVAHGMDVEQLIVDPGPDFSKTPAQTIELLRDIDRLHGLGRPLLLAISRKDFIGALTGRPPARAPTPGRSPRSAHGADAGAHMFRLHDVAAAADFLTVRAALAGELQASRDLSLGQEIRHEPVAAD